MRFEIRHFFLKVGLSPNCHGKTIHVTASFLKCFFSGNTDHIREPLTVKNIQAARLIQFLASMGPTMSSWKLGKLKYCLGESVLQIANHGTIGSRKPTYSCERCEPRKAHHARITLWRSLFLTYRCACSFPSAYLNSTRETLGKEGM